MYDPDKVVWFHTEDRKIHPYEAIREMAGKTLRGRMDAVVCYNDQTAQLVIRALQEEGLRIPEDVSVTGYDNSSLANQQGLRLTTIDHPQEKLGAMAAELLLSMIQNGEKRKGRVFSSSQCLLREIPAWNTGDSLCNLTKTMPD